MTEGSHPHDSFFKRSLQEKKIMMDWCQAHLPEKMLPFIDLSTLSMVSNEFINWPNKLHSDIVYSCQMYHQPGYLYLSAEHQSTPDEMMAFRILEYVINIMASHLRQGHPKLPMVLPLVLYHGNSSPYPHSNEIWACFENPELAKKWALGTFELIDLTVQSNEEIYKHGCALGMEYFFKHQRSKKPAVFWVEKLLREDKFTRIREEIGFKYIIDLVKYNLYSCGNKADPEELEKLLSLWKKYIPQTEEEIMTFAEQLEAKGIQKGKQEGYQQGKQEATRQLAKQLLSNGVQYSVVKISTGLTDKELKSLSQKNNQND